MGGWKRYVECVCVCGVVGFVQWDPDGLSFCIHQKAAKTYELSSVC